MTTDTTTRCAHCFDALPADGGVARDGDRLCRTCAHLAGVPAEPRPDPGEEFARQVCADAGVPLASAPDASAEPPHPLRGGEGTLVARLLDDVNRWCHGRWWHVRAPVPLFFAYTWLRHAQDPLYRSVFKGLNLGIHELGHYVFAPFGELMGAWGGSLLQCLVPLVAAAMFLRQRDYFAITFAWGWLATNWFEVSTYAADAVRMELPLVTPGGGHAIHDWNWILGDLGWLRYTDRIAELHRACGHACMIVCLVSMTWILGKMFRAAAAAAPEHRRAET
jgi:hypothetical protein